MGKLSDLFAQVRKARSGKGIGFVGKSTPAVKPRSANTNVPHGKDPSPRSISQPMPAPTRTPAISSDESRKPRASAEGSVAGRDTGPVSAARVAPIWSSR